MAKQKKQKESKNSTASFIKFFIPAFSFISGGSVMIVEIAASRLLAPLYGNTLFTWSSLIGLLLFALSIGYFMGGWLIDRKESINTFLFTGIISGLSVLCIIPVFNALESWLLTLSVKTGPAVSTLILFTLPAVTLGMITPMAIKLLAGVFKKVGFSAGTISMISTIGSVTGTFLAGYVLIPAMNINYVFVLTGGVVIVFSIIGLLFTGIRPLALSIWIVAGVILSYVATKSRNLPENVLFEKYNFYHRIRVESQKFHDDEIRILRLDTTYEGKIIKNSQKLVFEYTKYYRLYRVFVPEINSSLFIGGGGYAMPISLKKELPLVEVYVVEIDPEVEKVGRKYFGLDKFKDIKTVVADGRRYLYSTTKRFDLIFGDAYNGPRSIPPHLITREFFQLVKKRLTPRGVFMMNIISAIRGRKSLLFASVVKTLNTVFKQVLVFKPDREVKESELQNLIIVALPYKISPASLKQRAEFVDREVRDQLSTLLELSRYRDTINQAKIFTDRYNPVEYIAAIEE